MAENFATLITSAEWGTGTTIPTATDTGLEAPVSSTLSNITSAQSGPSVNFTQTLNSAAGSGSTLTEYSISFADGVELTRAINGGIGKTSSFELITISGFNILRA